MAQLSDRVRRLRKERGLTQEEVARRAGLTLNAMGDLERGNTRDPHYSTLVGVARALEVSVEELLREPVPLAKASETGPEEWVPIGKVLERIGAAGKAAQEVVRDWREEAARNLKEGTLLPKYRPQEMYSFHNELCRLYVQDIRSIQESARREDVDVGVRLVSGVQVRIAADPTLWPRDLREYVYEAGARIAVLPGIIREIEQEAAKQSQNTTAAVAEELTIEDLLPAEMLEEPEWREERNKALAEAGA